MPDSVNAKKPRNWRGFGLLKMTVASLNRTLGAITI